MREVGLGIGWSGLVESESLWEMAALAMGVQLSSYATFLSI
jgi:hypothetical protein